MNGQLGGNANVYASEIVLPSFERMDAVYCIKAY
jgi:hypothetical protein